MSQVCVETSLLQRNASSPFLVCQHHTSAWTSQKREFGGVGITEWDTGGSEAGRRKHIPHELDTSLPRQGPLSGRRPEAVGTGK